MEASYTVNVGDNKTVTMTGDVDKLDEIVKLMKSRDPWTHIVEGDSATLPQSALALTRKLQYLVTWTKGKSALVVESAFEGGQWYDRPYCNLRDGGWAPRAWQSWPTPPPLPSEGGEQ